MKSMVFAFVAFASVSAYSAARVNLGSTAGMLERLETENTRLTRSYTFLATTEAIRVNVEDFYQEKGELSMVGRAVESDNSDFILKGTAEDLYGWVVLKDRNLAFEYTTDAQGNVIVEQVPVTKIFPVCDFPEIHGDASAAVAPPAQSYPIDVPHIGPFPGNTTDITKLESLPGATKVIWIDMSRILSGTTPSGWTKEQVWQFWQGYAAGLSMYNVNVTTDPAVYQRAGVTNSGKQNLFGESGTSSCGLNAFGTTRGCTVYKKSTPAYQGGTFIHEGGHLLGLSHDGSPSGAYFGGFSTYHWCPIMGSHPSALNWAEILWQYSKGEYANANQTQDDFVVMSRHLGALKADDKAGTTPLKISSTGAVSGQDNWGQIERNTDTDVFSFRIGTGGGNVQLRIDRIEVKAGSMLDIAASIHNSTGQQVAQSNPTRARHAEFNQSLQAGDYTLVIRSGAEGTPSNGFSSYSSVGYYSIAGTISGGGPTAIAAVPAREAAPRFAGGPLRLGLPEGVRGEVALTALDGRVVYASRELRETVDLSHLPSGLYSLSLKTDGARRTMKVVKP